jgi:HAE1 family hydrophobic/amphiphilic exporter-1
MVEARTEASLNGISTVLLQIRKQSGTNTVEVANSLKDRLATLQQTLLPGYQMRIVRDEADFIEASIDTVEEHLVVGSLLAALVVWLFLGNLRSTIIAAISIPTSIIATFALIWYMGFTLNMLTMLALTLSVGIVIDDAIVVLENIYRFIEEKGMPPKQAAVEATREIGLAVLATTFSLVAIFAPVGFMSGMVGRFMQSFGLTMAFAVMVSLFVSFTLTPMMCAYWLKVKPPSSARRGHDSKHSLLFAPLDRGYTRLLEWAMAHRGIVAVATLLVLASSVPLFRSVNVNFTPVDDQSQFDVTVRAAEGSSLAATEILANRVARAIRQISEVEYTLVTVAGDTAGTLNTASVFVRLKPLDERRRDQSSVMAEVRNDVLPLVTKDGVRAAVQLSGGPGGGGGDIQFVLQGRRSRAFSNTAKRFTSAYPPSRASSMSTRRSTLANPSSPCISIDPRRPTSGSRLAMRPRRCVCWWGATRSPPSMTEANSTKSTCVPVPRIGAQRGPLRRSRCHRLVSAASRSTTSRRSSAMTRLQPSAASLANGRSPSSRTCCRACRRRASSNRSPTWPRG